MSSHPHADGCKSEITFRTRLAQVDRPLIERAVRETGFFTADEVAIAVELVDEGLAKGDSSDYLFLVAEWEGKFVGYSCYGHIPGSVASWDLYWIVVAREFQGKGVGKSLLTRTEQDIKKRGATRIYIDTSDKGAYAPTQKFYLATGYHEAARLQDFYSPGDGKIIYLKVLAP